MPNATDHQPTNADLKDRLRFIESMLKILLDRSEPKAKRGHGPIADSPHEDLTKLRVEEVERVFWKIVNSPLAKRRDSYRYPKALLEGPTDPRREAVVQSILINQLSLRRVFKQRGAGDVAKDTPVDRVRIALANSNLISLNCYQTTLPTLSSTVVCFSPDEARNVAKYDVKIPPSKGWTTTERATMTPGAFEDIPARETTCGMRDWGDGLDTDEGTVDVEDAAPAKPKREWKGFSTGDDDTGPVPDLPEKPHRTWTGTEVNPEPERPRLVFPDEKPAFKTTRVNFPDEESGEEE